MPLLPPELARPFQSGQERAAARQCLSGREGALEAIEMLSRKAASDWTASEREAFPHTSSGVTDPPPQRIARWASLFADEFAEVHHLVAGARPLSDPDISASRP